MESMIVGIGGVVVILALFGLLSRVEAGWRRRMIADATKSFQLAGELLPPEDVSLGPVDYRRIPTAEPVGYVQTTQQARHAPTLETSFVVPAVTAVGTALALTIAALALAWAFGWSGRSRSRLRSP
jgi:hypothetical protein